MLWAELATSSLGQHQPSCRVLIVVMVVRHLLVPVVVVCLYACRREGTSFRAGGGGRRRGASGPRCWRRIQRVEACTEQQKEKRRCPSRTGLGAIVVQAILVTCISRAHLVGSGRLACNAIAGIDDSLKPMQTAVLITKISCTLEDGLHSPVQQCPISCCSK